MSVILYDRPDCTGLVVGRLVGIDKRMEGPVSSRVVAIGATFTGLPDPNEVAGRPAFDASIDIPLSYASVRDCVGNPQYQDTVSTTSPTRFVRCWSTQVFNSTSSGLNTRNSADMILLKSVFLETRIVYLDPADCPQILGAVKAEEGRFVCTNVDGDGDRARGFASHFIDLYSSEIRKDWFCV